MVSDELVTVLRICQTEANGPEQTITIACCAEDDNLNIRILPLIH